MSGLGPYAPKYPRGRTAGPGRGRLRNQAKQVVRWHLLPPSSWTPTYPRNYHDSRFLPVVTADEITAGSLSGHARTGRARAWPPAAATPGWMITTVLFCRRGNDRRSPPT